MGLIDSITSNFQDWRCQQLEDGTNMYSRRFSGDIHNQLRNNLKSSHNLFTQDNQTIIVSCFLSYTNVAILAES